MSQPISEAVPQALRGYLEVEALSAPASPEAASLALLRTLGLGPGARVALPVWGSAGLAEMLTLCEFEVVPLDVDPCTGRLDVSAVARESEGFELLWMHDVNGLPPEASRLRALARSRDALVVEEVRESLGGRASGTLPGAHADAVLLRTSDGSARVGSTCPETAEEAAANFPRIERTGDGDEARPAADLDALAQQVPGRVSAQRRLAGLYESAWSPLEGLALPEYSKGTQGTWPRFPVRVLAGTADYPNANWVRWLHASQVSVSRPAARLVHGLDPDDRHVAKSFPGAVEFLRRVLYFPCTAAVTLKDAERTVYAVDELARRETRSAA